MNYDSPREIASLLESRGLTLKKRYGQNFLVGRGARERVLAAIDPKPGDRVWEIGPGIGSITELLVGRVAALTAFEIDRGFLPILEARFGKVLGFRLVAGDFLATWEQVRSEQGLPDLIFGNLPYSSASAILAALIRGGAGGARLVVTVQREVAERIGARPGTKAYGGFSILCQWDYAVIQRGDLKPGSFYPAPEVTSSVIELRPRERPPLEDRELFFALTRHLFAARRKTIRNNLLAMEGLEGLGEEALLAALKAVALEPGRRAESLSVEQVAALADRLAALRGHAAGGGAR